MTEIWYYIHIVGRGFLPDRRPSLQSALQWAEQITGKADDDELTIVEITKKGEFRKKTGFFDKWGDEVRAAPVGMPLTV